jgi:hypothetical protein
MTGAIKQEFRRTRLGLTKSSSNAPFFFAALSKNILLSIKKDWARTYAHSGFNFKLYT